MDAKVLFFIVIATTTLTSVLSLKCYYCESDRDGDNCRGSFNETTISNNECGHGSSMRGLDDPVSKFNRQFENITDFVCYTHVFKRPGQNDSVPHVYSRGCLKNVDNVCEKLQQSEELKGNLHVSCNTCQDDLCNSASVIGPATLLLGIVAVIFTLFVN